jgi:hypothetical protein
MKRSKLRKKQAINKDTHADVIENFLCIGVSKKSSISKIFMGVPPNKAFLIDAMPNSTGWCNFRGCGNPCRRVWINRWPEFTTYLCVKHMSTFKRILATHNNIIYNDSLTELGDFTLHS